MTVLDVLGLFGLVAGVAAVLVTLLVKGKSATVAQNWQEVAASATARAEEAKVRAGAIEVENTRLQLRVDALEQQVRVLVDTITAKDSIEALGNAMEVRFDGLTQLVVEALVTAGVPRAPGSSRRES